MSIAEKLFASLDVKFGRPMDKPNGDGIYLFTGVRHNGRGRVMTNDIVEVISKVWLTRRVERVDVLFFGRATHFPAYTFEGTWRKLNVDIGERSR